MNIFTLNTWCGNSPTGGPTGSVKTTGPATGTTATVLLILLLNHQICVESSAGDSVEQIRGEESQLSAVVEWDRIESLQTEEQLVEQQTCLFVKGADEGVAVVEAEQNVKAPFQFREPDVQAG